VYQRRTWDEFKRVFSVAHASQPVERAENFEYHNQLYGMCWGAVYSSIVSIFLNRPVYWEVLIYTWLVKLVKIIHTVNLATHWLRFLISYLSSTLLQSNEQKKRAKICLCLTSRKRGYGIQGMRLFNFLFNKQSETNWVRTGWPALNSQQKHDFLSCYNIQNECTGHLASYRTTTKTRRPEGETELWCHYSKNAVKKT